MAQSRTKKTTAGVDPTNLLAYRVLTLSQLLNRGIEVILDTHLGLSVRQWRVLLCVANAGPQSVQDIADFCRYDKSQVSRAVSELLDKKLVATTPSRTDGRRILVGMTAAGRAKYRQGMPLSLARQERLASCLRPRELETFEKVMQTLIHQAETLLQEAHEERGKAR
ncbi:MarR family winged helix-turn-helix transcriptional regulator [Bordetella sp. BOR01]|uniref:MarR family winged helix-turn-helix transcriptional regulator n=1 Tax=Bordetella sp. BOR01 TaxID=2854779 RepID=UPI001C4521C3|nr:MarR family winged helix-turn-helix transcriptional regulator [Bordetella sp. BOR01]MBV7483918.1 MarR family winged helix-turn-helix transcriptional regulator [Bordetella sp. BOR01]